MFIKQNRILAMLLALNLFVNEACTQTKNKKDKGDTMTTTKNTYGIGGAKAPEWNVPIWVDGEGEKINPVKLSDYDGKFKVVYCFQSWCPGCHSLGLPSLQEMVKALEGNDKVVFLAVQTVFEGKEANTFEKMLEVQKKYNLHIPFGQDNGDASSRNISNIMYNYRTGGTPWFIFIDQENNVVFNDFHLNTEKAIEYLQTIK
jgi:thiol-disulfide isomerase/thioredoxin